MPTIEGLLVGIVLVIVGLIVCFSGYGFWRVALVIGGFIAGYGVGAALIPDTQWLLEIIVGVVFAVVAGVLAYFLWSLGMVLAGLLFGAAIAASAMMSLGLSGDSLIVLVAAIVGAIVGAVLVYVAKDMAVILFLAFGGAAAVSLGITTALPFLTNLADPSTGGVVGLVLGLTLQTFNLIVIILLGLLGTVVQYMVYRARFTGELYFEQPV